MITILFGLHAYLQWNRTLRLYLLGEAWFLVVLVLCVDADRGRPGPGRLTLVLCRHLQVDGLAFADFGRNVCGFSVSLWFILFTLFIL